MGMPCGAPLAVQQWDRQMWGVCLGARGTDGSRLTIFPSLASPLGLGSSRQLAKNQKSSPMLPPTGSNHSGPPTGRRLGSGQRWRWRGWGVASTRKYKGLWLGGPENLDTGHRT